MHLEVAAEQVGYEAGVFFDTAGPGRWLAFAEVARGAYVASKMPEGMQAGLDEIVFTNRRR